MYRKIFLLSLVLFLSSAVGGNAAINNLNGLTGNTQTFTNDSNIRINSSGTAHAITWIGSLPVSRGGTGRKTLTSGQLLFGDTAASISQSANLFWDQGVNRLGIGNSSPDALLDVAGSMLASGSGDVGLTLRSGNDLSKFTIRTNSSFGGRLDIMNQSNILLSIASSGYVGIGATMPAFKLDVIGQVNASGGLCIAGDCKTSWPVSVTASGSANYVAKFNNQSSLGNSQIFDDGTGVGIGTTVPGSSKLKVNGVIESATGGVKFPDGTTQTSAATTPKYFQMGYDMTTAGSDISANTPTTISDLSVTATTGANNLKLSFTIGARVSAGSGNIGRSSWTLVVDGVDVRTYTFDTAGESNQTQPVNAYGGVYVMPVSAGSHTVQVKVNANVNISVLSTSALIVEEIAP